MISPFFAAHVCDRLSVVSAASQARATTSEDIAIMEGNTSKEKKPSALRRFWTCITGSKEKKDKSGPITPPGPAPTALARPATPATPARGPVSSTPRVAEGDPSPPPISMAALSELSNSSHETACPPLFDNGQSITGEEPITDMTDDGPALNDEDEVEPHKSGTRSSKSGITKHDDGNDGGGDDDEDYTKEEPFEVVVLKVIQLCDDIGWGKPSKVERMEGGSCNKIIGLTFESRDQEDYILRINRYDEDLDQGPNIKDQVALLQYLSQFLHVPKVAAFDSTCENALGSTYVIQHKVPGVVMDPAYNQLSHSEKLQIATVIAEAKQRIETIKFESPARIASIDSFPDKSINYHTIADPIKLDGFRVNCDQPGSESEPLGHVSITEFFHRLLEKQLVGDEYEDSMVKGLQNIASQMDNAGLMRVSDSKCVAWHWDFAPRNIMMRELTIAMVAKVDQSQPQLATDKTCAAKMETNIEGFGKVRRHMGGSVVDSFFKGCKQYINPTGRFKRRKALLDIAVEDASGSVHTLEVNHKDRPASDALASTSQHPAGVKSHIVSREISGILDWDQIMSVPRVLTRAPPLWLWCNEFGRPYIHDGNPDEPPARDLSQEELLIKAHYDQIMSKYDPSYIDDAYVRGPWLRRLADFAIHGLWHFGDDDRYGNFAEEWQEYYANTGKHDKYVAGEDKDQDSVGKNEDEGSISDDETVDEDLEDDDEEGQDEEEGTGEEAVAS